MVAIVLQVSTTIIVPNGFPQLQVYLGILNYILLEHPVQKEFLHLHVCSQQPALLLAQLTSCLI